MKKIICVLFYILIAKTAWSQDLIVAFGDVTTLPGSVLFVGGNLSVGGVALRGRDVTIESDATSSGSLIVKGTTTGKITYKRYVKSTGTTVVGTDWHLVSAPVTEQSIQTFVTDKTNAVRQSGKSGNYAVSYYQNSNPVGRCWTFHNVAGPGPEKIINRKNLTNFISGRGYSMNRVTAGAYTFFGGIANADVKTPLLTGSTHLWNSVGNPYPSFLPVNDKANADNLLKVNKSNLAPNFVALYFWDGTKRVAIRPEDDLGMELAPGQAFFIRAASGATKFIFPRRLQAHKTAADGFYRSSSSIPVIVLSMSNGAKKKTTTKLEYLDVSTYGLDVGLDAGAYQDGVPTFSLDTQLVSENKGIDFTIQSLPANALGSNVAVPLSVRAAAEEELTFSVDATNMPEDVEVYLEDVVKDTYTKITDAPYKITLGTSAKGVGRFYLHTAPKMLNVEDALLENTLHIYKTTINTLIISGLDDQGTATVNIYSITGTKVLAKQFVVKGIKEIAIPKGLATGVYVVSVVSEKAKSTKKIVIE
ncbi:MAG: T9SS type A sorting domain-containing protein [Polaribacter sp.]